MTLLILAFIAGVLTVLAPCTLPVLPIIIGGSLQGERSKWKPLIITGSLALSIIVFTLLLKFSTAFIDIPQHVWAYISGIILILFGLTSVFPAPWEALSARLKFSQKSNQLLAESAQKKSGVWSDILIGASLGPVFSSCSPTYFIILATVLPQSFGMGLVALIAYSLGLALILLLVAYLGQKFTQRLQWAADPHGWFKRSLGILFILVGLFVFTGLDKKAQTAILDIGFLNITNVEQKIINNFDMNDQTQNPSTLDTSTTQTTEEKAKLFPQYKEIVGPTGYVNTDGITLGELVGKKVIMVDFMTYSCINCIRTFPHLVDWYDKYKDDGLEIVGIHTPEFAFEKNRDNVVAAMKQYGIEFPIVMDNDYATWRSYENQYWPRKYLIDIDGYVVYDHIGEGGYEETEKKIQELLMERKTRLGEEGTLNESLSTIQPADLSNARSPETYFGALRNRNFGNGSPGKAGVQTFTIPEKLQPHALYLDGEWDIQEEYATNQTAHARIVFPYTANNVFLVMEADTPIEVTIKRDGEIISSDIAGVDVTDGKATIKDSRLYTLIEDAEHGNHVFELIVSSPGLRAFAFTFG